MTRLIVLRFDATCFDCGRSLSAGTTARWFGRGRVSCCGGQPPTTLPPVPTVPVSSTQPNTFRMPNPNRATNTLAFNGAPITPAVPSPAPTTRPTNRVAQLALDTGIPIDSLSAGMLPAQVDVLASKAPNTRLLVRLSSGARFIVPALHAQHVLRCVAESCVDRIRDVALLAEESL